jgi:Ca2+-binding EF-hand superfamily protein
MRRYDEWLTAMLEWQELQHSDEWDSWVATAFAQFDENGKGLIGEEDLASLLCKDSICAMPDIVKSALRYGLPVY